MRSVSQRQAVWSIGRPGTRAALGDELVHRLGQALAPLLRGLWARDRRRRAGIVGQLLGLRQVVERRHDQALGQVAGGAEDHHGAGRRGSGAVLHDFRLGRVCRIDPASMSLSPARSRRSGFACRCGHLRPSSSMATATTRVGLEAELALQLLERRRGAEGLHADDAAGGARHSAPSRDSEPCSTAMRAFTAGGSTSSR